MSTIVRGTIPAGELALSETFQQLPGIQTEAERVVQGGEDAILPLLWVRNVEREAFEAALEADSTVTDVHCLSEFEDELLYQMQWIDRVHLLLHIFTNGQATILDAYGRDDGWQVRVLYPSREHLTETLSFADEHGLSFEIDSIRELEGEPGGRFGLSNGQHLALVEAFRRGYFEVPRESSLEDVAEALDISHQALSERLRRGTSALIEDTLIIGAIPDES